MKKLRIKFKVSILRWIEKVFATSLISWNNMLVYRASILLQVVAPMAILLLMKLALWNAIFFQKEELVAGFSWEQMREYHCFFFLSGLLGQGHSSTNISEDIRMGRISSFLIYPFSFFSLHFSYFWAFQLFQFFVFCLSLLTLVLLGVISPSLTSLLWGIGYSFFIGFLWFLVQFCIGLVGFWLEETWILRVMVSYLVSLFSGDYFPLEFFPESWIAILRYTPFPYMGSLAVSVYQGKMSPEMDNAPVVLGIFLLLLVLGAKFLWTKGLRLYSGAGM